MSDQAFQNRVTTLVMEFESGDLPWRAICPEYQLIAIGMTRESALRALRVQARAYLRPHGERAWSVKSVELTLLSLRDGDDDGPSVACA